MIYNGEVVATQRDTANVMNTFFSNIVTNLKIPEYADYDPIARYRDHPFILSTGEACKKSHKFSFSFSQVWKKDILGTEIPRYRDTEIQRLDKKKQLRNQICPPELLKKIKTCSVSTYYLVLKMQ